MKNDTQTNYSELTTGMIAEHCKVTHRAVLKWVESGKIKAYRTPGRHSRVKAKDFVEFLQTYDMPIPEEFRSYVERPNRILVVDDDRTTVSLIKGILEKGDNQVFEAYDGFSAGILFSECEPDLITLDLQMPNVDGFDVLKNIKGGSKPTKTKIIVISSFLNDESIKEITRLGADAYMEKPIITQRLIAKVDKLLNKDCAVMPG